MNPLELGHRRVPHRKPSLGRGGERGAQPIPRSGEPLGALRVPSSGGVPVERVVVEDGHPVKRFRRHIEPPGPAVGPPRGLY